MSQVLLLSRLFSCFHFSLFSHASFRSSPSYLLVLSRSPPSSRSSLSLSLSSSLSLALSLLVCRGPEHSMWRNRISTESSRAVSMKQKRPVEATFGPNNSPPRFSSTGNVKEYWLTSLNPRALRRGKGNEREERRGRKERKARDEKEGREERREKREKGETREEREESKKKRASH